MEPLEKSFPVFDCDAPGRISGIAAMRSLAELCLEPKEVPGRLGGHAAHLFGLGVGARA
jgi:hypothetical protein